MSCTSITYKPYVDSADLCFSDAKTGEFKCSETQIYTDTKRFHPLNSVEHESIGSLLP